MPEKEKEERVPPKLVESIYCHLGNGGFTVSLIQHDLPYPGIDINFEISHMGAINSTIKVHSSAYCDHFLTKEQLLHISKLFAKAAEIVDENNVLDILNKKERAKEREEIK